MKYLTGGLIFSIVILFFMSCMDDESLWKIEKQEERIITDGVFIVNEGNFMYENASISYYDPKNKKIYNDVFFKENGVPIGDVAQSMIIKDSLAYIVVNNSGRIYVINANTFKLKAKITGFTSPRYMHFSNNNIVYVSDLYAKSISIVNIKDQSINGSINLIKGTGLNQYNAEQMVQFKNMLITNCWSYGKTLLFINTETGEVIDTMEVGRQPQSLVIDKYNKLWVLTDGGIEGSSFGYEIPSLRRIDIEKRQTEFILLLNDGDHPSELCMNHAKDSLFYINRHVYCLPIQSEEQPILFIHSKYKENYGGYYGLGVDPSNADIYVADAKDMIQNGSVYRYSRQGELLDSFNVGIIPGSFCFKSND